MTRDPHEGLDRDGRIVTGIAPANIASPYDEILTSVVEQLDPLVRDGLHSLYVYGSVATGQARPPSSDVDLYAVTTRAINDDVARHIRPLERHHGGQIRGVGLSCVALDDVLAADRQGRAERCFIRHYCVHLTGKNLRPDLPACRADIELARELNGDLPALVDRLRDRLDAVDDAELHRRLIAHGARRVLMAAATVLSIEGGSWSTDRSVGADLLASVAPELADDASRLAFWATSDTTAMPTPLVDTATTTLTRIARWIDQH